MNSVEFLNPKMFWLLCFIPAFVLCFKYYQSHSSRDLKRFAGALTLRPSSSLRMVKMLLLCIASLLLTIALAEPVWKQVPKELRKEGRDLVFILDVSNSMLAEDLIPNRLEKAKISITECINSLKNHRIGLVIFAGSASIKCPLTLDYDFFLHILSRVSNDSISYSDDPAIKSVETVAQGGTLIQDAVMKTCEKLFTDSKNGNKDIILISDGGDQGKNIDRAIEAINEIGAKIITIGLGDSINGARIPLKSGEGFMKYKGKEVWTKLENETLKSFSRKCKFGAYLPAGTKQMDLAQIYDQFTQNEQGSSIGEQEIMVYKDEYPLFLSLALAILLIMVCIPSSSRKVLSKALSLILVLFSPSLKAASLSDADDAYEKGKYNDAIRFYVEVAHKHHDKKVQIYFNIANSYYRLGNYESAIGSYRNTLSEIDDDEKMTQMVSYNLANAMVKSSYKAEKPEESIAVLSTALRHYRRVIMQNPDLKQAVVNFELAKIELFKKKKELEEERKKQEEIQKQLAEIRALLEKAITEQKTNIDSSELFIKQKKSLVSLKDPETKILNDSSKAEKLIKDLEAKNEVFKEMKVFEACLNYLKNAIVNEKAAESFLANNDDSAIPLEKEAHGSLIRALDALPEDPEQQSSDDGESEDDGEYSEEEEEEEGEDGGDNVSSEASDIDPKDEQNMELPNDSIEDILKMEDKLHKMRKAAETKGRMKKVDKDW